MADDTQEMELADLKGIVDTVTKPVLDGVEGLALQAVETVRRTVKDLDPVVASHIEASIYEEVVVTCAKRVVDVAAEINDAGDTNRADLVHLSLASALKQIGIHTGNLSEDADG